MWSGPAATAAAQRRAPVLVALPRGAVDQVQADVLEPGRAGPCDAALRAGRAGAPGPARPARAATALCMPSEIRVKPPAAARPATARPRSPGSPRWSPQRPARARTRRRSPPGSRPSRPGGSSVGVPPPKNTVHRRGGVGAEHLPGQPDLRRWPGPRRTRGWRPAAKLGGGVGVEVAVAAPGLAERHVHVDAERLARQALGRTAGQAQPSRGAGSPAGGAPGTARPPRWPPGQGRRGAHHEPAVARSSTPWRDLVPGQAAALAREQPPHEPGVPVVGEHRLGDRDPLVRRDASLDRIARRRPCPRASTRRYAPGRRASANRLTQCRSSIQPANITHGIRGLVTWTTAVPSRQVSPISAPEMSSPPW